MNSTETKTELPLILTHCFVRQNGSQYRAEFASPWRNSLDEVYEDAKAYDIRTRLKAVEKELAQWAKISAMVSRKPVAITWEQGVEILNALKNTVEATSEALKGEG